jgi:DNA transposition AAA+ family ATPase
MEKVYNPILQQQLEEFITKVGGQTKAAQLIGYSTGTLSTYRTGKYNGDVVKLEKRLQEYFGNQQEAATLHQAGDYVPTSISQSVYDTIRICHLKGGLAIECGDAGIGKTKAAQKYLEDYPNTAIYVTVNPCLVSITAFLKLLCRRLKVPMGRKDDMWLEIDEQLQGGKKVLIIDEAQHLPIKTIESIRAFFDSNPDLGIIMIGNVETVINRSRRGKESFAQIKNRTKLTEIRHTTHITKADMRLLFPALAGQEKELELLHVIAQSEEGVRGAVNLYSNAQDNENTSYEGLLAMARAMKIVSF